MNQAGRERKAGGKRYRLPRGSDGSVGERAPRAL